MTPEDEKENLTSQSGSTAADAAVTATFHHGPDVALIRRVAQGDAAAQQELADRLVLRVRRAAHALMRGSVDADDAAQHALIELLRSGHRYRGKTDIERWADRITGSSVIRFARAVRRRAPAAPLDELSAQSGERAPRNLEECLSRLQEGPRDALLLRHAFGHGLDTIAELTQVSPDTVRDRLSAARRELRRLAITRKGLPSPDDTLSGGVAERWAAARDREALGEALSSAEQAELASLEAGDPEVQAYVQQMRELESYLEGKANERLTSSDRELVRRALSAVQVTSPSARLRAADHDAELAGVVDPEGPGWIRMLASTLSVSMAVGAALALIYYEPRSVRRAGEGTSEASAGVTTQDFPSARAAEPALAPKVEALAQLRTAERGARLRRGGKLLMPGTLLSQGDELSAGDKPGCVTVDSGVEACIGLNSSVRFPSFAMGALTLDLRGGRVALDASDGPSSPVIVNAGAVRASSSNAVFGLERNDDASLVRVRALRGQVLVQSGSQAVQVPEGHAALYRAQESALEITEMAPAPAQREWELVAAGMPGSGAAGAGAPASQVSRAEPSTAEAPTETPDAGAAPPAPSARDLMQQAWDMLKAERWSDAAATYERIGKEHPGSQEAHIVQVRLGELWLERLAAPERALQVFDRYLGEGSGPLDAEARYGRITAFRRLGKLGDEKLAIEEFVGVHPNSPKVAQLEARLRVLSAQQ